MIDSRIPIVHSFPNNDHIKIYFSSDMHVGHRNFDEKQWHDFEKLLQEPDTYVIFAGDQMEYATPRSRSSMYETVMHPREVKQWWIDHLKPYAKDKLLCLVDGNHEWNRASREADAYPLYDIAYKLDIEERYRSEAAFVDVGVGRVTHGGNLGKTFRYIFRVCHKATNQVKFGTADAFDGIDIFVAGHTHQPLDKPLGKMVYNQQKKCVYKKTVENFVCGSFLTYGGYAERDGMRPPAEKTWSVELCGTKKRIITHGFRIDEMV